MEVLIMEKKTVSKKNIKAVVEKDIPDVVEDTVPDSVIVEDAVEDIPDIVKEMVFTEKPDFILLEYTGPSLKKVVGDLVFNIDEPLPVTKEQATLILNKSFGNKFRIVGC